MTLPANLPYRLKRLFVYTCDLYRPSALAPLTTGDLEAADVSFGQTSLDRAYTGVPCWYEPTPTFDALAAEGLTKEVNIMTSDRFWFLQSQEIDDAWLIVLAGVVDRKTPPHPLQGSCWVTQGQSTVIASVPGRPADSQWIYAKLSPNATIPGG